DLWFLATTVAIPPTSTATTPSIVIVMCPGTGRACHSAWTCYFGSLTFAKDFTGNWLNSGDRSLLGRSLYCYRTGWDWTHRRGSRLDTANFLQFCDFIFNSRNDFFVFFRVFKEIRNVEESVAV